MDGLIKIVSDGTMQGTKVYNHQGFEIKGVMRIKIDVDANNVDKLIKAELTIGFVELDLKITGAQIERNSNIDNGRDCAGPGQRRGNEG